MTMQPGVVYFYGKMQREPGKELTLPPKMRKSPKNGGLRRNEGQLLWQMRLDADKAQLAVIAASDRLVAAQKQVATKNERFVQAEQFLLATLDEHKAVVAATNGDENHPRVAASQVKLDAATDALSAASSRIDEALEEQKNATSALKETQVIFNQKYTQAVRAEEQWRRGMGLPSLEAGGYVSILPNLRGY